MLVLLAHQEEIAVLVSRYLQAQQRGLQPPQQKLRHLGLRQQQRHQLLPLLLRQVSQFPQIAGPVQVDGVIGGYGVTQPHQLVTDANAFKDLPVLLLQHPQTHQ